MLTESGKKSTIICPYYAWAYDFDGKLINAQNSKNIEGFNKCDFTLKEVRLEIYCGMIMINLDQDTNPSGQQFEGLDEDIRKYMPSIDGMNFAQRDTYEFAANWKAIVDNFLEC